jgi:hypothetical protein
MGLNIIQQLIHDPLKGYIPHRRNANQLHNAGDIRKPYASNPSVTTVPSMDMRRTMVIRKYINPGTNAF